MTLWFLVCVLTLCVSASVATGEVRRRCEISYALEGFLRWSRPVEAPITFVSPDEFSLPYKLSWHINPLAPHYALAWFGRDQVAVLAYTGITFVRPQVFREADFSQEFGGFQVVPRYYLQANVENRLDRRKWRLYSETCREDRR